MSAMPSGNSVGGTAWKIEYNKQTIYYAMELSDKPSMLTPPFSIDQFKNANFFITNSFLKPTNS